MDAAVGFLCIDVHWRTRLRFRTIIDIMHLSGELIPMSHHEFFTLLYLAQHPGWVFSKKQIYEAVWKCSCTVKKQETENKK